MLEFFVAFFLINALTPLVISLSEKTGLVDDSSKRVHPANTHTGVVSRAGGLALYLGLVTGYLFLGFPIEKQLVSILVGGGAIVFLGLLDDKYDLKPLTRLVITGIIVTLVVMSGLGIPYISNPMGGVIHLDNSLFTLNFFGRHLLALADIVALLWILALMNFVSWSSGLDGQLSGFVSVAFFFMGFFAFRVNAYETSTVEIARFAYLCSGIFAGFFVWSFYPQKIMPGYAGGTLAGYLLGFLSLLSYTKVGTLGVVLAVPITDAGYVMMGRILAGKSPLKGDASHFHHRLLASGWGRRRIALFYLIVSLLFGSSLLFLKTTGEKLLAFLSVVILLGMFIWILQVISSQTNTEL